jgi:hypothetical protein
MGSWTAPEGTEAEGGGRSTGVLRAAGDRRAFIALAVFVGLGAAVSIGWIIASRRFLYADSSYFLLTMWTNQGLAVFNPGRWFGFVASQWIPVLAMKSGWDNLGGIATLFGLNLWLNPVLTVCLVWWASRRSVEITTIVLAMELLLFQSTYAVIDNESSVFFWMAALLFVVTSRREFPLAALLLVIPLTFVHEVLVIGFAPALALLLAARHTMMEYYGARRYRWFVTALALSTAFAFWWILQSPGSNRSGFISGTLHLYAVRPLMLTTTAFLAVFVGVIRPQYRWVGWLFWFSSVLLLVYPFANPNSLDPNAHYRSRALNGLLAAGLFLYLFGRTQGLLPAPRRFPLRRLMWLSLVIFVYQGKMTWEWSRHLDIFRGALQARPGVQAFPIGSDLDDPRVRQFIWGWTTPVMSIVFQAMEQGEVGALMENRRPVRWQPFDPRNPSALPDLSSFGVGYRPVVLGRDGGP